MSLNLDTTRINRDVQKYVEEIIQHLTSVDGAKVTVSLEVQAESDEGFTQQTSADYYPRIAHLLVQDSGFKRNRRLIDMSESNQLKLPWINRHFRPQVSAGLSDICFLPVDNVIASPDERVRIMAFARFFKQPASWVEKDCSVSFEVYSGSARKFCVKASPTQVCNHEFRGFFVQQSSFTLSPKCIRLSIIAGNHEFAESTFSVTCIVTPNIASSSGRHRKRKALFVCNFPQLSVEILSPLSFVVDKLSRSRRYLFDTESSFQLFLPGSYSNRIFLFPPTSFQGHPWHKGYFFSRSCRQP